MLQAPNPKANPPGASDEWIQKHFVTTTTTTVVVDESSSDDDWGAEEVANVAKRARKTASSPPAAKPALANQESEGVEEIWGDDAGSDDDDVWGDDAGGGDDDGWDNEDDDEWGDDEEGGGDWDAPETDVWDSDAEATEEAQYPLPPEADTRACSGTYKDTKTVVDILDYATAAKRLVWLEKEFRSANEVAYLAEWPLERVRKLLSAYDYDFQTVCSTCWMSLFLPSLLSPLILLLIIPVLIHLFCCLNHASRHLTPALPRS